MVRISDLDLIRILKEDARTPFTRIAEKFCVSETAIRKRVKKLLNKGVIKRFTIEVDPKKLGFEVTALIGVDTEPEAFISVIEKMREMEKVISLYTSTGDHMLLLEGWFKNTEELVKFVEELQKIKGVTKVCPAIILEKIK